MNYESYAELKRQKTRLALLQLLAADPAGEAGAALLMQALPADCRAGYDQVEMELSWLATMGFVTGALAGGVRLARITRQGLDIVEGRVRVPGVARIDPGSAA